MKIHADKLIRTDLYNALTNTGLIAEGVFFYPQPEDVGSRSRDHAFNVHLAAMPRDGRRRKRNMQHVKNDPENVVAATYDEWGFWIADLFKRDPEAIIGQYRGAKDFHIRTQGKYRFATMSDVENFLT